MERAHILVSGQVQGVGFRRWVSGQAKELCLAGYAQNLSDGRVEVLAEGDPEDLDALYQRLSEQPSQHGRPGSVTEVTTEKDQSAGLSGFQRF